MEDQEKITQEDTEDVEAHKRRGGSVAGANEESPGDEAGSDDDFELHRRKGASDKL